MQSCSNCTAPSASEEDTLVLGVLVMCPLTADKPARTRAVAELSANIAFQRDKKRKGIIASSEQPRGHRWINKYQYLLTQSKSSNFSMTIALSHCKKCKPGTNARLLRGGEEGWEGKELYQKETRLEDLDTNISMKAWWMISSHSYATLSNYPAYLEQLLLFTKSASLAKLVLAAR